MNRPAPPFYPNTPDETHCLQASVKMVLDAKAPELKVSLADLLFITGNSGEPATWPIRAAVYLANSGFDVIFMDPFPLNEFVADAEKAMRRFYGDEPTDWQLENSNIERAVMDAQALLANRNIKTVFEIPEMSDLSRMLQEDYLCICNVNARTLNNAEGYAGHFVVVYDVDMAGQNVMVQNPGPPSNKEAVISFDLFDKAWASSGPKYKNILAVRASDRLGEGVGWLRAQLQKYKDFVHKAV